MVRERIPISSRTRSRSQHYASTSYHGERSQRTKNHHSMFVYSPDNFINLVDDDDPPPPPRRVQKKLAFPDEKQRRRKQKIVIEEPSYSEKRMKTKEDKWIGKGKGLAEEDYDTEGTEEDGNFFFNAAKTSISRYESLSRESLMEKPREENWRGKEKVVQENIIDNRWETEEDDEVFVTEVTRINGENVNIGCGSESPIVVGSSDDMEFEDSDLSSQFGLTTSSDSLCFTTEEEDSGSDPEFKPDNYEEIEDEHKEASVEEDEDEDESSAAAESSSHDSGPSRKRSRKVEALSTSSRSRKKPRLQEKKKQINNRRRRRRRERDVVYSSSSTAWRIAKKKISDPVENIAFVHSSSESDDERISCDEDHWPEFRNTTTPDYDQRRRQQSAGCDEDEFEIGIQPDRDSISEKEMVTEVVHSFSSSGKTNRRSINCGEEIEKKQCSVSSISGKEKRSVFSSSSLGKRKRSTLQECIGKTQQQPSRQQQQQQQPTPEQSVSYSSPLPPIPPSKKKKESIISEKKSVQKEVSHEISVSSSPQSNKNKPVTQIPKTDTPIRAESISSKKVLPPTEKPNPTTHDEGPVCSASVAAAHDEEPACSASVAAAHIERPVCSVSVAASASASSGKKRKAMETSRKKEVEVEEEELKMMIKKPKKPVREAKSKNAEAGMKRKRGENKSRQLHEEVTKKVVASEAKKKQPREEAAKIAAAAATAMTTKNAADVPSPHCVARRTRSQESKDKKLSMFGCVSRPITLEDEEDKINPFQDQQSCNGIIDHHHTARAENQEKPVVDLDVSGTVQKEENAATASTELNETENNNNNNQEETHTSAANENENKKEKDNKPVETDAVKVKRLKEEQQRERLKNLAKKRLTETELREILLHSFSLNQEKDLLEEIGEDEKRRLNELNAGFIEHQRPQKQVDEFDPLWMEMEMYLAAQYFGSTNESCVINEAASSSSPECVNQRDLCQQGKHDLVLEEQIGMVCRYCDFIETETHHLFLPFHTDPFGNSSSRRRRRQDYSPSSRENNNITANLFKDDHHACDNNNNNNLEEVYIPTGTVWDIIPGMKKGMYPHQEEGFEFMWKNIGGSTKLKDLPPKHYKLSCGGCIMSHAPGTGKTRLAISFLHSYLKFYKDSRPVIIAPCSMLLTWEKEFKTWNVDVPFHNLNDQNISGLEHKLVIDLLKGCKNGTRLTKNTVRIVKLNSWLRGGSVLGISYKMFEQLVGEPSDETRKKKKNLNSEEALKVREWLIRHSGLLVLDEGHTPRNESSKIFQALSSVETNKRIILSGTPFQNNLNELYNTLCLVQPLFADRLPAEDKMIFTQRRGGRRDKERGQLNDLNYLVGGNKNDKLNQLRARIKPFVHIHKGAILLEKLPGLSDCVVLLKPPEWQKQLFFEAEGSSSFMESDYMLSLLSVHPSLICPDDEQKTAPEKTAPESTRSKFFNSLPVADRNRLKLHKSDHLVGLKARFVIELVRLCTAIKERVLVFSQFIEPLEFLNGALSSLFNWKEGHEIHYMHGKMLNQKRQTVMDTFNDPNSDARVMLASTKACSEGIKLVGASRVVLLDVVWNPSVERQAISRAYRIGQKKRVYVYHLIASGTNESDKYCRQIQKDKVSELVFWKEGKDEEVGRGEKLKGKGTAITDDSVLDIMVGNDSLKSIFEKIVQQPKFDSGFIDSF